MSDYNSKQLCAGRRLDALVAEKVMGWNREENTWRSASGLVRQVVLKRHNDEAIGTALADVWTYDVFNSKLPDYSTNISQAWKIIEALSIRGGGVYGRFLTLMPSGEELFVRLSDDVAETICLAALSAIEGKQG